MAYQGGVNRPGAKLVVEEPSDEVLSEEVFSRGRVVFRTYCAMRHGKLLKYIFSMGRAWPDERHYPAVGPYQPEI